MSAKLSQPWFKIERIENVVQLEPALLIMCLCLISWVIYKYFLKNVSNLRHELLREHFRNLGAHLAFAIVQFATFWILQKNSGAEDDVFSRLAPYTGLVAIVWWSIVLIKTSRLLTLEYLFLGHMKEGVPQLLVNLFSLLLSMVVAAWILTVVFEISLAPLLATSAVFSVVLGLALQDTLGNLFAGVALQFDKPFEIGHWVEVNNLGQKSIGQVHEISWRATILMGLGDEYLVIPNRVMGQSQISNYSTKNHPIIRTQTFRVPFSTDLAPLKKLLVGAALSEKRVRKFPEPIVLAIETTESWLTLRMIYFVDDFGAQFAIADGVLTAALKALQENGVKLAVPRLDVEKSVAS